MIVDAIILNSLVYEIKSNSTLAVSMVMYAASLVAGKCNTLALFSCPFYCLGQSRLVTSHMSLERRLLV